MYDSEIVYAPTFTSRSGILDTIEDEEFNPSNYIYFDKKQFEDISTFILYIQQNLKVKTEFKIIFEDLKLGDSILFTAVNSSLVIRIPPRKTPMEITREFILATFKKNNTILELNQPIKEFNQLFMEANQNLC